ncbi:MAG: DUF2161 family putative PD-(D/E)XK-type phosphodiesterase [Pseudomonadota bacterium]
MKETDLYQPVKALLEAQGYTVKGEVGSADVVAVRGVEPPVIVELKTGFSLALYHQAVARLRMTERVYIAVPRPKGPSARRSMRENLTLCRRLGLGLITVSDGVPEIRCDPGPYRARKSPAQAGRLLKAFARLEGDPNDGGATRHGLVTGYRQEAVRCAAYLAEVGPEKGALVARATGVREATRIMAANHYGWFERIDRGIYGLTDAGRRGLADWADAIG